MGFSSFGVVARLMNSAAARLVCKKATCCVPAIDTRCYRLQALVLALRADLCVVLGNVQAIPPGV